MTNLTTVVFVEFKKFFKSRIPWLTALAALILPFVGGLFMFILKDPELARKLGVISTKAHLAGTADWSSYLGLLAQAIAIGGLILFGFISSWIFGREYSDRTLKDLLALPSSRVNIVFSKFIVMFLWCMLLSLAVSILGYMVGGFVQIPGGSPETIKHGFQVFFICAFLTTLLSTPVALFASIGRGYLSPLGFVIFTLVFAQIIAATGYGQYFPWSIPAIASGAAGAADSSIGISSIIIVLITSIAGLSGTVLWWRFADHT